MTSEIYVPTKEQVDRLMASRVWPKFHQRSLKEFPVADEWYMANGIDNVTLVGAWQAEVASVLLGRVSCLSGLPTVILELEELGTILMDEDRPDHVEDWLNSQVMIVLGMDGRGDCPLTSREMARVETYLKKRLHSNNMATIIQVESLGNRESWVSARTLGAFNEVPRLQIV